MRRLISVAALGAVFLLAACVLTTKHDIIQKASGAHTRQELESALGAPDDVTKLGPVEQWTYKARDGEVTFVLVADQVTLETTDNSLLK